MANATVATTRLAHRDGDRRVASHSGLDFAKPDS
jgi:hypothetical protein